MKDEGVDVIIFENPLQFHHNDSAHGSNVDFYNRDYTRTETYYKFLKYLFELYILNEG
jgi:hypothetical protein